MRPAARKKGNTQRFLAESGFKDGSARCARSRRSCDRFVMTGMHYGNSTSSMEQRRRRRDKQGRRTEKNGDSEDLIARLRNKKKPRSSLPPASAKPEMATGVPGRRRKLTDGEVSPAGTVLGNYRIATRFKSQITPKFVWQLKNL